MSQFKNLILSIVSVEDEISIASVYDKLNSFPQNDLLVDEVMQYQAEFFVFCPLKSWTDADGNVHLWPPTERITDEMISYMRDRIIEIDNALLKIWYA